MQPSVTLAGMLHWCTDLPVLSDQMAMSIFIKELADRGVEVVFLDPFYLCLGDVKASDVFEMGNVLRSVASWFTRNGITMYLLHHSQKGLATGKVMQLSDLAFCGLPEFVRQWVLINRRTEFAKGSPQSMWFNIGGSAGQGGNYGVAIDEGTLDDDFAGRFWQVRVEDMNEAKAETTTPQDREKEKCDKTRNEMYARRSALLDAIDEIVVGDVQAATKTQLKTRLGWNSGKLNEVALWLIEDGKLETHTIKVATGKGAKVECEGFRRFVAVTQQTFEDALDHTEHTEREVSPDDQSACSHVGDGSYGTSGLASPPCKGERQSVPYDPHAGEEVKATPKKASRKHKSKPDNAAAA